MAEPITFAEAAAHLRLGNDVSDQTLVEGYIIAAREYVENITGQVLVRRSFTEYVRSFGSYIELHRRPIITVDSISYTNSDGVASTASFLLADDGNSAKIYPAHGERWPSLRPNTLVAVTYTAGYLAGAEPEALRQAMLLLVAHWYANRETTTSEPANEVPFAVDALCDLYRVPSL